ncbi:helix-turn-helix domain-containing protein [Nocardiopsis endophytica]|uniref:helix-turn-helix domain-containing protein n=1 Tax=Nocardiopsis endophytica TaxID=3018445 RepID=UPI002FD9B6C7
MGPKKSTESPALRKFGRELARMRTLADLSQEAVGRALNLRGATIGHYERALRTPSKGIVAKLDEVLEANGSLLALWPEVSRANYPEYAGEAVESEPVATLIRDYQPLLIPGLLQTEPYARATLRAGNALATEDEITRLVNARMERQRVITESDSPVMWVILDEGAVRRRSDDPGVMYGQLGHLIELVLSKRVRIQIVPADTTLDDHPGLSGPFTLMSFRDKPDVAYVEGVGTGGTIVEAEAVEAVSLIFGGLQSAALSPTGTAAFLERLRGEFDGTRLAHVQLHEPAGRDLRRGGGDPSGGPRP